MAQDGGRSSRRQALKTFGVLGAATMVPAPGQPAEAAETPATTGWQEELRRRIEQTPLVDTHEHLPDEEERLRGQGVACDDWAVLISHYLNSDLFVAGMPAASNDLVFGRGRDPLAKWQAVAPYWPAVKNTGYGRAVRIALRELYGIDDLNEKSVPRLQQAYEALRKPGFYQKILCDMARIESCQVNYLGGKPFKESRQPTLLMQDISIVGMHIGPDLKTFGGPTDKTVRDLADWHAVIRWWFDKYGPYAVAVKSQAAYMRALDYDRVPPEKAEAVFRKVLRKEKVSPAEQKLLEDHLFWFAVEQANRHQLPVKLHTGYYAGHNGMPLARVAGNPGEAAELCRKSPETQFVFMHIGYPYWEPYVALAKHFTNAHIDMCWAWLVDPPAATRFLKSYLLAAPSNKVLTFGGDYVSVECVLGHARLARRGIRLALEELVAEGWLERPDALELVEPLLRANARRLFRLQAKLRQLRSVPWL